MYLSNLFSKKIKIKVNFFSKGHICPSRSLPTRDIHVPSAVKGLNKCDIYINRQCTYIVFILQCQKVQKQLPKCHSNRSKWCRSPLSRPCLYCYRFWPYSLHESGTRKGLLCTWLNKTEINLAPLLKLTITQLQDKIHSMFNLGSIRFVVSSKKIF